MNYNDIDIETNKSWKGELARPEQEIPEWQEGEWIWMILAGRGFGKTRTGAETIMELVNSGQYKRIGIIGKSIHEVKDVMVEGISGLLSTTIGEKVFALKEKERMLKEEQGKRKVSTRFIPKRKTPENEPGKEKLLRFKYYKSRNIIVWENGAIAYLIGGDNYDKIRGYQFDLVWIDEFAKYDHHEELWNQVMFSLRLGKDPKCIITTTPKPVKLLKTLSEGKQTHLTTGTTYDNKDNLSEKFIERIKDMYGNTKIGKQEIEGILTFNEEDQLWKKEDMVYREVNRDDLTRVVIGIDPAVSSGKDSDETGIVVAGLGYDDRMYVLDDLSGKYKPSEWAKIACRAQYEYNAGMIVAEVNNGGDLVEEMIKMVDPYVPIHKTRASSAKISRAEPISYLYESNKVFHSKEFPELEDQMCAIRRGDKTKKGSPDRVDALVWALSELKNRNQTNCGIFVC